MFYAQTIHRKKNTHMLQSHKNVRNFPKKKHKHTRSGKKSGITYGWKKQNVNHWDICYTNSVPRIIFLPRQVYFRQFVYCIVQVCIQQPATQSSNEKQTPSILIENVNRAKIHWQNQRPPEKRSMSLVNTNVVTKVSHCVIYCCYCKPMWWLIMY